MSTEKNPDEEQTILKKLKLMVEYLTPGILVVISTVISMLLSEQTGWKWIVISIIAYVLAIIAVIITTMCVTSHYNNRHGNPEKCQEAMDKQCLEIEQLHCRYFGECQEAISKMNSKVIEQQEYFQKVDQLVDNAKQFEKMYLDAVAERLRNNKQIAGIESRAKRNSEIFIMTSSFLLERYNSDMRKSIANNIIRGVKYRYIIPYNKENEYRQMVYAVMKEIQDICKKQNKVFNIDGENDFLKAVQIPEEYCMLTVAYYELNDPEWSNVIVKLPADTMDEVNEQEALTYLVPTGSISGSNNQKYYSEHKIFLDKMTKIYQNGKENSKTLIFSKSDLTTYYPDGVEISQDPPLTVRLDEEAF